MARAIPLDMAVVDAVRPAAMVEPAGHSVPTSRTVRSLEAVLQLIRRHGGSVTSETRTAPGIGSWAFVSDREGNELVLWESAAAIGR